MEVRVRVPTQLRELVAGVAVVTVEVPAEGDGAVTVGDVLDVLGACHPALERRLRDEQGQTRTHVNLFVGADNVRDRDGPGTPIAAGEELTIIPAVSGG
jgi:sulfur-carrier protein